MHESYQNWKNHQADFRVKYKFRTPEEGGRLTGVPYQGIRCDFSYVNEDKKYMYIIWPEFEDEKGNVILYKDRSVPKEGTARMWIMNPIMRESHYNKVKVGIKGNFREGKVHTADCEIIEILDIKKNPIK